MGGLMVAGDGNTRLLVANAGQAAAISALHVQLFERGWDVESVWCLLAHPASLAFVAVSESSDLLGFVVGQLAAGEAEILSLGVSPDERRHGTGASLIEAFVAAARHRNVRRLFLDVAEGNVAALALYMRLGFAEMGRRKAYYLHAGGGREDALLMVRVL